jgi:hypothetical protein
VAILEVSLEERRGQGAEAQDLAARADGGQQGLGRAGHQQDVGRGSRLLEALEQRVLRLLRHGVRVVDHERARATLEGAGRDLAHQGADLLDLDGRGLGLDDEHVGMQPALHAAAGHALAASVPARLAEKRPRHGKGEGALPHPLRPAEEQRGG